MNKFYTVVASPKITDVVCPKHRDYMTPLTNGILGEDLWWCIKCDCPYYLRPAKLKKFNREAVAVQLGAKSKRPGDEL